MLKVERKRICSIALENARSNFLTLKYEMAKVIQDSLDAEDKASERGMNEEYYKKIFMPLDGLKIVVLPKDYYREIDGEINPKYDDMRFDGKRFKIDGEKLEPGLFEKNGPIIVIDDFDYLENPNEDNYLKILMIARNSLIDNILKDWDYSYNNEKDRKKNDYLELEYYIRNSKGEMIGPDTFHREDYCLPNDTSKVIIRKVIYSPKEGITNNKADVINSVNLLSYNDVNYEMLELFDLRVNDRLKGIERVSQDIQTYPIIIEFSSIYEIEKYMSYLHTRYIECDQKVDNSRYAKVLR